MIRTLALAALASLGATAAVAQDMDNAGSPDNEPRGFMGGAWSFGVGAATDNRSKDASKSDGEPFVYALTEWNSASEFFYFGAGAETIKSSGSRVEAEAGFGIRPQFAGFDLDLNATHKWRLDSDPGVDDDAWEFTANVSRSIGPASGRLQIQHSPDGTGSVRDWTWVEGRIGWDFTDRLEGAAAIGRREQDNSVDYTGWNAGVTYALNDAVELDLRYYDTDADDIPGEQYASALVAGIDVAF